MTDALAAYIRDLVKASAESTARAQSDESRRQQEEAAKYAERATPLTDRIKRVIAAMPESERNTPRPLEFWAVRLSGRQSLTPHRGELAAALRTLGYSRRRNWRRPSEGYPALWYAPVND
ncbi:MAG: hypothetical protein K0M39_14765 [Rhizobium sp.]|nr:hypothetical protein [Rhizobium sp.]